MFPSMTPHTAPKMSLLLKLEKKSQKRLSRPQISCSCVKSKGKIYIHCCTSIQMNGSRIHSIQLWKIMKAASEHT